MRFLDLSARPVQAASSSRRPCRRAGSHACCTCRRQGADPHARGHDGAGAEAPARAQGGARDERQYKPDVSNII
eukprot:6192129-Pleurochrysis_carterae.AAC.1